MAKAGLLPHMNDRGEKKSALVVATFSSFLTPFLATSINIALPAIQSQFHADAVLLSWVATAFLLSTAVSLVPAGRLADIYGRKKVFLRGMILVTAASLLTAFSISVPMLIFFRIFQGIGTAMIFSTQMAILTSIFPPGERGSVLGINVAAVYAGLSCGPFFGGALTQHLSWRSLFLVPLPLCLISIYLIYKKLKGEWAEARGESFDLKGSLIYGATLVMLVFGLSRLPSISSIALLISGGLGLAAFVKWELTVQHPVFEVRLFSTNRVFAFSCLAALIHYSATFALTFMMSLYLQYIKGLTPQMAGLVLMAQPLMMALFSPLAGKTSDRIEPRWIASGGMALMAFGLISLSRIGGETGMLYIVLLLLLIGFGYALFSSPNMNAIMSSVERRYYGVAAGSVATMRLIGQMFSMGIATLILSLYIGRVEITPEYYSDFLRSVNTAFVVFAVLSCAGIFLSMARGELRTE
jgi:EmrB/QacA subfamily drug resistance transporter